MRRRLALTLSLSALVAALAVTTSQGAGSPQQTADRRFNVWTPAIAVYEQEYDTYVGMTKSKLARFDYGILEYPARVVWGTKTRYCLQTTVAGRGFHRRGPVGPFAPMRLRASPGKCPAK